MNPDEILKKAKADSHAFAVAHGIVDVLKRVFFSWLPFLLLWRWAGWPWAVALLAGIAVGYGLEAVCNRLLSEDETD